MTAQRARSSVDADHRSAHPDIPGVPWWGAILIAVAGTALGFALDAMTNGEKLTGIFAGCYAAGCVVAVFAVRYSSIFTAVVQPPLILFLTIPLAYMIMSQAPLAGGKSTAITIGYPLIERFPLMISTALGVLIIGVVRWYWGIFSSKTAGEKIAPAATQKATKTGPSVRTRVRALVDNDAEATGRAAGNPAKPRRRTGDATGRTAREGCEPDDRRRRTQDSGPVSQRSSAVGTPWEDERPMRTERRPARRDRDDIDGYGYEPQPRYREPRAEPTREPHRPVARYRDERPPAPSRRPDNYEEIWDRDR